MVRPFLQSARAGQRTWAEPVRSVRIVDRPHPTRTEYVRPRRGRGPSGLIVACRQGGRPTRAYQTGPPFSTGATYLRRPAWSRRHELARGSTLIRARMLMRAGRIGNRPHLFGHARNQSAWMCISFSHQPRVFTSAASASASSSAISSMVSVMPRARTRLSM